MQKLSKTDKVVGDKNYKVSDMYVTDVIDERDH